MKDNFGHKPMEIRHNWQYIYLHHQFFPIVVYSFLFIDILLFWLLFPDNSDQPFISLITKLVFSGITVISLASLSTIKHQQFFLFIALFSMSLIPLVLLQLGLTDERVLVHLVLIAFLLQFGLQSKKLSYWVYGLLKLTWILTLFLCLFNSSIEIFQSSIAIKIKVIASIAITFFLLYLQYRWFQARSYYRVVATTWTGKINDLVHIFSLVKTLDRSIDQILSDLMVEVNRHMKSQRATVYLINEGFEDNEGLFSHSPSDSKITILRRKLSDLPGEIEKIAIHSKSSLTHHSKGASLSVPILTEKETIGVIKLDHIQPYFFNKAHLHLLEIVASYCSSQIVKIQNKSLQDELLELEIEAEALQELGTIQSRFVKKISHDIQTPITLILEPSNELLKYPLDEDTQKMVHLIRDNGQEFKETIDQLRELNKIDFTIQRIELQQINADQLLRMSQENFDRIAGLKNQTIQIEGESGLIVPGDRKKLLTIIHNLFNNAVRYTPFGGTIVIKYGIKDQSFFLEIHDSGPGIPEEFRERVFERFFRLREADGKGTGIGLSIVTELAQVLGGNVKISDSILGGVCFRLSYDTHYVGGTSFSSTPYEETSDSVFSVEKPILLIVDDNKQMREFLCTNLGNQFNCVSAANGILGYNLAVELIPDLIITDLMMSELNGAELCKKIRLDEKTNHIPIIVLSAKSSKFDRLKLYELGADNFLAKPCEIEEVSAMISGLLTARTKLRDSFKESFEQPNKSLSIEDSFIERVVDLILEHLDQEDFNVVSLSRTIGLGRNQLQRKIKALTDMTPVEFIRYIRLKEARDLLLTANYSVSDVTYHVGFSSLSYFAKKFKQTFGVLPSELKTLKKH